MYVESMAKLYLRTFCDVYTWPMYTEGLKIESYHFRTISGNTFLAVVVTSTISIYFIATWNRNSDNASDISRNRTGPPTLIIILLESENNDKLLSFHCD
jgi:hypothetical protein